MERKWRRRGVYLTLRGYAWRSCANSYTGTPHRGQWKSHSNRCAFARLATSQCAEDVCERGRIVQRCMLQWHPSSI